MTGPFDGVPHATLLLDRTRSTALRHSLLKLLQSLLCPREVETDPKVTRVATANAAAFTSHGGVELLVDLLCVAHEGRDRTPIGGHQTNLIASTSYAEIPKVCQVAVAGHTTNWVLRPTAAQRAKMLVDVISGVALLSLWASGS
jgi:hypothetical protein